MRRMICLVLALLLCASLAMPAFAAFTPSVSAKDTPEIPALKDKNGKEVKNDKGEKAVATFVIPGGKDEDGEEAHVFEGSLLFTSVSDAKNKLTKQEEEKLTEQEKEIREQLQEIFEQLEDGKMEIPYEEFDLDPKKMVVRDLFDISWHSENEDGLEDQRFEELMDQEECELHMTFDLGVAKNAEVHVFTYKDHTPDDGKDELTWGEILSTENNGDGTITCVFGHLCPVAVCIEEA